MTKRLMQQQFSLPPSFDYPITQVKMMCTVPLTQEMSKAPDCLTIQEKL